MAASDSTVGKLRIVGEVAAGVPERLVQVEELGSGTQILSVPVVQTSQNLVQLQRCEGRQKGQVAALGLR